ncbi:MAG: terpene cyclase/mutase family protein [Candidatus Riflebacteria bacterium]|nr:terpene cyclase/mutase family protein [Candidatus Riflebacteria bacterium]
MRTLLFVFAVAATVAGPSAADHRTVLRRAVAALVANQRPDGGFGYRSDGMSFADATAWAMLSVAGRYPPAWARARAFLLRCRRGRAFSAFPGDPDPSWMTAPVALALLGQDPRDEAGLAAVRWLLDEDLAYAEPARLAPGWPWTPGCAPWVEPTSITALCLGLVGRGREKRVRQGLEMVRLNEAKGGGWSLYETRPYPYHTALVVLAHLAAGQPSEPAVFQRGREALVRTLVPPSSGRPRSPLDLASGALALAAVRDPRASVALDALVGAVRPDGSFGGALETAFAVLAFSQALDDRPLFSARRTP